MSSKIYDWLQLIQKRCKVIPDSEYDKLDVEKKKEIDKLVQERICQITPMGGAGIGNISLKHQKEKEKKLEDYIQIFKKMVRSSDKSG